MLPLWLKPQKRKELRYCILVCLLLRLLAYADDLLMRKIVDILKMNVVVLQKFQVSFWHFSHKVQNQILQSLYIRVRYLFV